MHAPLPLLTLFLTASPCIAVILTENKLFDTSAGGETPDEGNHTRSPQPSYAGVCAINLPFTQIYANDTCVYFIVCVGVTVPALSSGGDDEALFLWEATLQGSTDLQFNYLNGLEDIEEFVGERAALYTQSIFDKIIEGS